MTTITLPHNWRPRDYQLPAWSYMATHDSFRALLMWHRRSGKDDIALHMACRKMHQRVGNVWHMLPEAAQARKAIWDAINPHTGKRRIDEAFPRALRASTNNSEMYIKFKNGSMWQVVGSDNYDSLVGSSPMGIVFSEWALAKSMAWAYMRPILLENGGWAAFITTPRGKNHAYRMYQSAKGNDDWFVSLLDCHKTKVFTPAQLESERKEYIEEHGAIMGPAMFEQEYLCSFDAAIKGAYYTGELRQLREQGRLVSSLPVERMPASCAWDLGIGDSTAIWVYQEIGREVRIVAYYESSGAGLDHYVEWLEQWRIKNHVPSWGDIIIPHDGKVRELGTGKSREETLDQMFGKKVTVLSPARIEDGINAVRREFPRFWIDETACADGVEAISQYRREYDEKNDAFYPRPNHDWTSHCADALRYLAMGLKTARPKSVNKDGSRRALRPKLAII